MAEWRNWSGSVRASPARIARPRDEAELSALVREAAKVRVAGAGHSFTPLCENLGSVSTFARAYRLVLVDGSAVECSPSIEPDLFQAQRLSLGLFGVASRVLIDVVPAYRLEERIEVRPLAEIYERFHDLAALTRHAEFWVFPYADQVIFKTLHPTDDPAEPKEPSAADEIAFRLACDLTRAIPAWAGGLHRLMMRLVSAERRAGPAHRIFPSDRGVRFEEMEYEVPRAAGLDALREAIAWVRRGRAPVAFPFEFRLTAADDIWLSPFHAGPCASISMHQYAPMPWREVFAGPEAMLRAAGGRPHWAKRHSLTREDVDALYPMAERYRAVRRAVDPEGKFLNPHLAAYFS
jgi:FAD/FMN-containing dehydrogenase